MMGIRIMDEDPPISVLSAKNGAPLMLQRDAHGCLLLALPGQFPRAVVPVRAFPLSAPEEGISLVATDGHELCWVEQLSELAPETRALIEEELAERHCTPVIRRITRISSAATPSQWEIETDRGTTRLTLKAEEDIRRLPDRSLLITDAHGLSFMVRDIAALDKHSRRLLDHFL